MLSGLARSQRLPTTRVPYCPASATAPARFSPSTSNRYRSAPSRASARLMARPIPEAAPVTSARLPRMVFMEPFPDPAQPPVGGALIAHQRRRRPAPTYLSRQGRHDSLLQLPCSSKMAWMPLKMVGNCRSYQEYLEIWSPRSRE